MAFPDLEVNNEGTTAYVLPTQTAENVVGLMVQSNGQPVQTTPTCKPSRWGSIASPISRRKGYR